MSQIQKWGNSLGVRIPKALAMEVGLEEGLEIDFDVEDGHLVIKPRNNKLDELLSKITPDNLHSEVQSGESQGRETW
ncbi:AbrB/MazE/SpoVT family DNA-binding domain-containing protein [Paenibacillus sp. JCM 10914]|uniref:AbrB/MazE/SpoVT family DNA-binding domain-containing protein n=1 Tax=Paenibacillus sp. JCM 10914 TaxID=1236974 RepID=UPI0003CC4D83|nr:AbrB/MazE/SpoVT family DNA-binding domain-containing protein [Paenibacillus sp. JCM 10914]GAE08420.1 programmed cell death antitoxin MazE [Paenibacillus sp. JCM 10914]